MIPILFYIGVGVLIGFALNQLLMLPAWRQWKVDRNYIKMLEQGIEKAQEDMPWAEPWPITVQTEIIRGSEKDVRLARACTRVVG